MPGDIWRMTFWNGDSVLLFLGFQGHEGGWKDLETNLAQYKEWIFSFLELTKKKENAVFLTEEWVHHQCKSRGIYPESCFWKEKHKDYCQSISNTKILRPKKVNEMWEKDQEGKRKTVCNCPTHSVERSKALSLPLLLFHFYSFSLLLPFYIFVVCLTSLWSVISILSILLIILVLCSRKQKQSRFYTADKVLWIACYCVKCSVNTYPKIQFSKLLCRLFTWTHR